jgi:glucose-6-phosphate isomerase, archaeal
MANLVSTEFSSEYVFYDEMHWAAYYELAGNSFEKNSRYPDVPALRKTHARAFPLPLCEPPKSLYDCIGDNIIARLLNHPENYLDFWSDQFSA